MNIIKCPICTHDHILPQDMAVQKSRFRCAACRTLFKSDSSQITPSAPLLEGVENKNTLEPEENTGFDIYNSEHILRLIHQYQEDHPPLSTPADPPLAQTFEKNPVIEIESSSPSDQPLEESPKVIKEVVNEPEIPSVPTPLPPYNRKTNARPLRKKNPILGKIYYAAALLLLALWPAKYGFTHYRQELVWQFPKMMTIYEWLKMDHGLVPLKIDHVASRISNDQGAQALDVQITISNDTNKPRPLPLLRIAVLDKKDQEIQYFISEKTPSKIESGEKFNLKNHFSDFNPSGQSIAVRFLSEDEVTGSIDR